MTFKLHFLVCSIFSLYAFTIQGQNFNRPIPPGEFYKYEFVQNDTNDYGYYFCTPLSMVTPEDWIKERIMLMDKDGYLTWYSTQNSIRFFNFQYQPDTSMFSCYFIDNPMGYNFLDSAFQIKDTFDIYDGLIINPHDFIILNNGNVAFILYKDSIMDLSAYTFNGIQGSDTTHVTCDILVEVDAQNNIVMQWQTLEHIPFSEFYEAYDYSPNAFDYTHCNAVAEDLDGHLLLSFRHLDAVYKIHRQTGEIIWRVCGKSSDFTFTNDIGFSGPHDIRVHPEGSYSVFDNAVLTTNEARAITFTVDTVSMTATKTWEYKPDTAFQAQFMGSHQITADTNHVISYGTSRRPFPSVDFVTHNGQQISQIFFQDTIVSYRTYVMKLPFELPRPMIACTLTTGGLILSAPAGFQSYKWSTGETTPQITVSDTGNIYQVWVNYGIGMLGSHPFDVNYPGNMCAPMSVEEYQKQILEGDYLIFDLLGRQVVRPVHGQMYIYRYANGFSKLKYFVDY